MNRYVYHYCAQYRNSWNEMSYVDGIALLEDRIVDQEGYRKLKPLIDTVNSEKLTITNLSFLGMEKDNDC